MIFRAIAVFLLLALTCADTARAARCADGDLWIDLNLPAFRLDVYDGTDRVARYVVAPGAPRFRTPRGRFEITRIEWNPWWIPPDSPWARHEKPARPGPDNPMGRVKLHFRPLYFLHGTPYDGSIGTAASHGCVRLRNEDAVTLAMLVLRSTGSTFDDDSARTVLASTTTRSITLPHAVPVHIRYDLVEVWRDTVAIYRDVYDLGRPTTTALRDALWHRGIDTTGLDDGRVRDLLRRGPRGTVVLPIDSLRRRSPRKG